MDPNPPSFPTTSPARRKELGLLLRSFLPQGEGGVYFQGPGDVGMEYPAVVYKLDDVQNRHANNKVYSQEKAWLITVIDLNPDSSVSDQVSRMPKCTFDRAYPANGLNHTVYSLYF